MDYDFHKHILTLIIIKFILISYVCGKEGECHKTEWRENKYVNKVYCCTNYEMKNGTCRKCGKGFTSTDGGNCQLCTGNAYGTGCLDSCSCTEHQICHPVAGCITLQSTSFETSFEEKTVIWITTPTFKMEERVSTESNHGPVPFNSNIVIYSVCIAGLLVVITICFICCNRLRFNRNKQIGDSDRQPNENQNAQTLALNIQESMIRLESIYDEIDEVSVHDDDSLNKRDTIISNEPRSEETSYGEHENLKDDDYLNPYQPIVKDFEKHDYNTVAEYTNCTHSERKEDKGIVQNGSNKLQFETPVIHHEYLPVIEPSCEYLIKSGSSRNSAIDKNAELYKKTECAEIVLVQKIDYHGTSQLNICMSKECKTKGDKENKQLIDPVSTKRQTI